MRIAGLAALLIITATVSGCIADRTNTISHTGGVRQTLRGPGGLQVRLVRYLPRVPARHDVSGLATPTPGMHFVAFLIHMCIATSYLPTIAPQNFALALANGVDATLKFPQSVFAKDLDLLGAAGCERGHIVFEVPHNERPTALRFGLDWSTTDMEGFTNSTKLRFEWKLSHANLKRG
ncbi:MAG TPA: hypothetical protein VGF70_05015 [Solirubrobacteraceae bacterium]